MKKKIALWIILDLIFLIVFNTVFFVAGGADHPASVWISYGFIHFAYLMVVLTPFLIRRSSSAAVFGLSLYAVSSYYFLVEFVIGLIFIFIRGESYKAALIVQVIIAGIYAVMLLSNMLANEHTADQIERQEDEVAYIKTVSSRVKMLIGRAQDKRANKEIEKAYDILHASPSRSIAAVSSIEFDILKHIAELEVAVYDQNTPLIITVAGEIVALAEERNRKIRLSQ